MFTLMLRAASYLEFSTDVRWTQLTV